MTFAMGYEKNMSCDTKVSKSLKKKKRKVGKQTGLHWPYLDNDNNFAIFAFERT